MCGFVGSFNTFPNNNQLYNAFNCINYRGEVTGLKKYKSGLVMATRLARTGIKNTPQPIVSNMGNLLVFNGEIYNYRELAEDLDIKYSEYSDSEILLYWLEQHDNFILPPIEGEFSFVYIKPNSNQLYMVRDTFGTKPLYYYIKNDIVFFGSSPKSISFLCEKTFSIDIVNSSDFLWYGVSPEGTVFSDIFFVKPGYVYKFEDEKLKIESIESTNSSKKENYHVSVLEKMEGAIKRRVIPYENECAIAFSGGVDSTIIKELANKNFNNIKLYHLATNEEKLNESLLLNPNSSKIKIKIEDVNLFMSRYFEAACRPVTSFSGIGMSILNYNAKVNGAKIILSGECADEIFCGYPHYFYKSQGHPTIINRDRDRQFLQTLFNNIQTIPPSDTIQNLLTSHNHNDWLFFDRNIRLPEHLCLMNCDIPSLLNKIENRLPFTDLLNMKYEAIGNITSPKVELYDALRELNICLDKTKKGLHVSFSILNDEFINEIIEEIPNQTIISELIGMDVLRLKEIASKLIKKISSFPAKYQVYVREILLRYIIGIYSFSFCLKEAIYNTIDQEFFTTLLKKESYTLLH